jgi:protein TonB
MSASSRAPQRIGAVAAVALHVLALAALLSYEPARSALFAAAPIMVDLIAPPRPRPKPEAPVEIVPPKPKPKPIVKPRQNPPDPEPLISAPEPVPPPEPAPAPPVAAASVPAPVVAVTPPVFNAAYLNNPPPAYPARSRRIGEEGRVVLRVLVGAAGSAEEVQIRDSSGHRRLDERARDTVRRWKFIPARHGERPIAAWVLIPISFRLEG